MFLRGTIVWLLILPAFAGAQSIVLRELPASPPPSGNPHIDLVAGRQLQESPIIDQEEVPGPGGSRKSPWLAAGMSALLPGSGEFYAERYLKSAIFLALEAAFVTAAIVYENKGDDQTVFYRAYADQHWSVVSYGQYTEQYEIPPAQQGTYVWYQNGTVNWDELNRMERAVGTYYSHTLPPYGSQQYYELIGKYPQYNQGWDDAEPGKFNHGDPLTPNFLYYAEERGKANDYYSASSTAIVFIVLNHIVSAADAAWSASSYNADLHAHASLKTLPLGSGVVQVPAVTFSYRLP